MTVKKKRGKPKVQSKHVIIIDGKEIDVSCKACHYPLKGVKTLSYAQERKLGWGNALFNTNST